MANRRMFSLDVIDTDLFLEMPATSQSLYFHLGMRADDDGFVSSPKKITKMVNCAEDDLNVLASRGFIIPFENGIIVISHWKQNNYIQRDRHKDTIYQKELSCLTEVNGVYKMDTNCIQNVSNLEAQDRIGKDRIGKDRKNERAEARVDSMQLLEHSLSDYEFSDALCNSLRDWIQYKKESGFRYKETGLKNLLKEVSGQVELHGEAAVCKVIQESIAAGWKGIAWSRLDNEKLTGKVEVDGNSKKTGIKLFS